jgi:hypothetical protein
MSRAKKVRKTVVREQEKPANTLAKTLSPVVTIAIAPFTVMREVAGGLYRFVDALATPAPPAKENVHRMPAAKARRARRKAA